MERMTEFDGSVGEDSSFGPVSLGDDDDHARNTVSATISASDSATGPRANANAFCYFDFFRALVLPRPARSRDQYTSSNGLRDESEDQEGELPLFSDKGAETDSDSSIRRRGASRARVAEAEELHQPHDQEERKSDRPRRRRLKLAFFLLLERTRLFPEHWFHKQVESGTDNPLIADKITSKIHALWKPCILGLLATVVIMYALAHALYQPPTRDTVHLAGCNLTVGNVYSADAARIVDPSDSDVRRWLQEHGPFDVPLQEQAFADQYFSTAIYDPSSPSEHFVRNITFSVLEAGMRRACAPGGCRCISALHLGVPANLVLLNTERTAQLLVDPQVCARSPEHLNVTISQSDGIAQKYEVPVSVRVEYRAADGLRHRDTFTNTASACVYRCMQISAEVLLPDTARAEDRVQTEDKPEVSTTEDTPVSTPRVQG